MHRRTVVAGGIAAGALWTVSHASARNTCGLQACIAELDFRQFQEEAASTQSKSEWCWAASISMVFAFHGHPVEQERIVREVYGTTVNLPVLAGAVIAAQINRRWVDDNGETFRSRLRAAFDAQAGVIAVNNAAIVTAILKGWPVIVGTAGHAVVLTSVVYQVLADQVNIIGAGVFDPWPGRGARGLTQAELAPVFFQGALTFIGIPEVSDV